MSKCPSGVTDGYAGPCWYERPWQPQIPPRLFGSHIRRTIFFSWYEGSTIRTIKVKKAFGLFYTVNLTYVCKFSFTNSCLSHLLCISFISNVFYCCFHCSFSWVECGPGVTGGLCDTVNPPVCEVELRSGFGCDPDLRSVLNPSRGPTFPADTPIKSWLVPLWVRSSLHRWIFELKGSFFSQNHLSKDTRAGEILPLYCSHRMVAVP